MVKKKEKTSPDFLVIGAMKSGTTTLYEDLGRSTDVFIPRNKEPGVLTQDYALEEKGRWIYRNLYAKADDEQICGDFSTVYSMQPTFMGVPERAFKLCGKDLKIVYIMRDPVKRIVSQYRHHAMLGKETRSFSVAIRENPLYLNISRYSMQLEKWLEFFPPESIHLICFEEYVESRDLGLQALCSFLGITTPAAVDVDRRANSAEEKLGYTPKFIRIFTANRFYRFMLINFFPEKLRLWLKQIVCRKPQIIEVTPSPEDIAFIQENLQGENEKLEKLGFASWRNWGRR